MKRTKDGITFVILIVIAKEGVNKNVIFCMFEKSVGKIVGSHIDGKMKNTRNSFDSCITVWIMHG